MNTRNALVVRGGWEGHHPVEATELFLPFLERNGFTVRVEESNEVYADAEAMAATDLVLQSVTSHEALRGLRPPSRTAPASPAGTAASPTRTATTPTTFSWSAASSPPILGAGPRSGSATRRTTT